MVYINTPTNFAGVASADNKTVALSWTPPVVIPAENPVVGYNIWRYTGSMPPSPQLYATSTSITDLPNGGAEFTVHYHYSITAISTTSESAHVNITVSPNPPPTPVAGDVVKLTLGNDNAPRSIIINWSQPKDASGNLIPVASYFIRRSVDGGTFNTLVTGNVPNEYTDSSSIVIGSLYAYKVFITGASAPIAVPVSIVASKNSFVFASPVKMIKTLEPHDIVDGGNKVAIDIEWGAVSTGTGSAGTTYDIYESIDGGVYTKIVTSTTSLSRTIPGLVGGDYDHPNASRAYYIIAKHLWGTVISNATTNTNAYVIYTFSLPEIPTFAPLRLSSTVSGVDLSWNKPGIDNGFPVNKYKIYSYSISKDNIRTPTLPAYNIVYPYPGDVTSVTDDGNYVLVGEIVYTPLVDGSTYWYTIAAGNDFGDGIDGSLSSIVANLLPTEPLNCKLSTAPTAVTVTWDAPSYKGSTDILYYTIYRVNSLGEIVTGTISGFTYVDTGLELDSYYKYYVTATNVTGEGLPSTTLSFGSIKLIDPPDLTNILFNGNFETGDLGTDCWVQWKSSPNYVDIEVNIYTGSLNIIVRRDTTNAGLYVNGSVKQKLTLANQSEHEFYVTTLNGHDAGLCGINMSAYDAYDPSTPTNPPKHLVMVDPDEYRRLNPVPSDRTSLKITAASELNINIGFGGIDTTTKTGYINSVMVIDLTEQFGAEIASKLTAYDMDSMLRGLGTTYFDYSYIMSWDQPGTWASGAIWYNELPLGGFRNDATVVDIESAWGDLWSSTNVETSGGYAEIVDKPANIKSYNDKVIRLYKSAPPTGSIIEASSATAECDVASTAGHIYFITGTAVASYTAKDSNNIINSIDILLKDDNGYSKINVPGGNITDNYSLIYTATTDTLTTSLEIFPSTSIGNAYFDCLMLIDLTAVFGSGNEPTVTAMEALVSIMHGLPTIEYGAGTGFWIDIPTIPVIDPPYLSYEDGLQHVNLQWSVATADSGVIGYLVFRGEAVDDLSFVGFSDTNSYIDEVPAVETTYYYIVKAMSKSSYGENSTSVSIETTLSPSAPTIVNSVVSTTERSITIAWIPPASIIAPVIRYHIYRSMSTDAPEEYIFIDDPTILTFTDTPVEPATTYKYQVAAVTSTGESERSNMATLGTPDMSVGVANFDAGWIIDNGAYNVHLTWDDRLTGVNYNIYKTYGEFDPTTPLLVATTALEYTDIVSVTNALKYMIIATSIWGSTDPTIALLQKIFFPSVPRNFAVTNTSSTSNLLTWTAPRLDGNDTILKYNIYRKDATTPFAQVMAPGLEYRHTISATGEYCYFIDSQNTLGAGAKTAVKCAINPVSPIAPENFSVSEISGIPILRWTTPADIAGLTIESYNIYMSEVNNVNSLALIANVDASVHEASHIYAKHETDYYYAISTVSSNGLESALTPMLHNHSTAMRKFLTLENKAINGGFDLTWSIANGWVAKTKKNIAQVDAPAGMLYESAIQIDSGSVSQSIPVNAGSTMLALCMALKVVEPSHTSIPAMAIKDVNGNMIAAVLVTDIDATRYYLTHNVKSKDERVSLELIAKEV